VTRSKGLLLPDVQQENYSLEMRHDDIGKVLYRRMEKSEEGKDDALEGAVEHQVVDRLIEDLSRSRSVGSDKWTARCTVLQELLRHHIDEEEGEFFKIARKIFDRDTLARMGTAFTAEKTKLASAIT
jgi:hemerythrin-like domain-containing protein